MTEGEPSTTKVCKSFVALGISLVAGAQAHAQVAPASGSEPPAASAAASDVAEGDIVVTAQRRSESLQKVPISITAVNPERLEQLNLRSVDAVTAVTPGLVYGSGFGFSQTFIRGVGTALPTPGLEGSVATYVDGSYYARGIGAIFELLDVQSVQVLKGPQGTLYGRNATGGAIIVDSAAPTDQFEGHVLAEYGRYNHALAEAVLNAPVSDTFAVRFAGRYTREDGYIHNLTRGKKQPGYKSYILRGSAKWEPTSDFSGVLTIERSRSRADPFPHAQRLGGSLCLACTLFGLEPTTGFYNAENDLASPDTLIKSFSANLRMRWNSGIFKVESVTGYRNQSDVAGNDLDGTAANLIAFNHHIGGKTYNQDFTVSTDSGSWVDGIVGVSYLLDKAFYATDFVGLAFAGLPSDPFGENRVRSESVSAFAELSFHPTEALTATIGGRYSYDRRRLQVDTNLAANLAFAGGIPPLSFSQRASFRKFTPRAVLAYQAGNVNLYTSFNRGFKAGGFSTQVFAPDQPVKPETIDSYELGAKFVSPDRKFRANVAVFHYSQKNLQVRVSDLQSGGGKVRNAASSRGYGVEGDFEYTATKGVSIYGGAAYLDTKFRDYRDASVNSVINGVFQPGFEDLTGFRLPSSPKFTSFLGVNIEQPMGESWIFGLSGVARYSSSYDLYPGAGGNLRFDRQSEFVTVNMSGFVGPADKQYQIGFYVNNLTNEKYILQRLTTAPFGATEDPAQPRTYGVRARYDF